MARPIEVTRWIAKDGKECLTEQDAIDHENFVDLVKELECDSSSIYWRDTNAEEVAAVILKFYNITKKAIS